MNVVWLSWKDRGHPLAGGAEEVSGKIIDHLVSDGHSVRHITAQYPESKEREEITPGYEVYRSGNKYSVYFAAHSAFNKIGRGWADVVIDEMNTLPFWAGHYSKDTINVLLAYQLAREIWFYQMVFPLSYVGYALEPLMLRFLSRGRYNAVATESHSSEKDLAKYGFGNIHTFRVGIATEPLDTLPEKKHPNMVLSLGSVRPMKRTLEAVKSFEFARDKSPDLAMVIAGDVSTDYGKSLIKYVNESKHKDAIEIKGRVSNSERLELMRSAGVILVTSVKEGWGLIVTESNSQGTPAIVYDVDGLRDSVVDNVTGMVVPNNNQQAMGVAIIKLLSDVGLYETYRQNAWESSKQYTFENSYNDFIRIISQAEKL